MYQDVQPVRICQCGKMIPAKDRICNYCGEDDNYELTSEEVALSFNELLNQIDNAFFRFENYLRGNLDEYNGFGFAYHFIILFAKAKHDKNNTVATSIRITLYFRLLQQHVYDVDKGRYNNKKANDNNDFVEDCEDMSYICNQLLHKFLNFETQSQIDEFNKKYSIEDISKEHNIKPNNLPVQINDKRHLVFNDTDTVNKILERLSPYFEDSFEQLEQALLGKYLEQPLLFPHNQNRLVEVFRRLQYNRFLLSNSTEIADWLCKNFHFRYTKGDISESKQFNRSTVYEILTKGKGEPSNKSRILQVDWLPYHTPAFLKRLNAKN
jgi:hypothetical protein